MDESKSEESELTPEETEQICDDLAHNIKAENEAKAKHKQQTLKATKAIRLQAFTNKIEAIKEEMNEILHGADDPEKPYGIKNCAYLKWHSTEGAYDTVFEFDADGNPISEDTACYGIDAATRKRKGEALVAKWIKLKKELDITKAAKNAL